GNQCWMKENLNIGSMVNDINSDTSFSVCTNNGIIEKYCFDNNPSNCNIYGGLYDWHELMQYSNTPATKGICPEGWHIPTVQEYDTLINLLLGDTIAGAKVKETGLNHWMAPNIATNESGFTALGGGLRSSYGGTGGLRAVGCFWTSTQQTDTEAYEKALDFGYAWFWQGYTDKYQGFSVRCLKNNCPESPSQSDAGPDQVVTDTITQLAGNNPQSGQGSWSIISGAGGVIPYYYAGNTEFRGIIGTSYKLVWTISTPCNQTTDTVVISFVPPTMNYPCPGIPTLDYGGQTYNTVQIGTQCWMKENLNIGNMISGALDQSDDGEIQKYCYNNSPENCSNYGALYQWDEAMQYSLEPGSQGICPTGWHIPTEDEWCTLLTFLDPSVSCSVLAQWTGTFIGDLLKEEGSTHWLFSSGTNASGFSATGSGYRYPNGQFYGLQVDNYTWSSELFTNGNAFNYSLMVYGSQISHLEGYRQNGHAVRCIKDIGSD
ncbi:MAG: FISUMP domain-containing protein, partial [Bacteroidales bacterium]